MTEPGSRSTGETGPRIALMICVLLIVLLGLGLLNVWVQQPPGTRRVAEPGPDSLTTDGQAVVAADQQAGPAKTETEPTEKADSQDSTRTDSDDVASASQPGTKQTPNEPGAEPEPALPSPNPVAVPEPPAATDIPRGPWSPAFDHQGEVPNFEDVCFRDFDLTKTLPLRDDLLQWFTTVAGEKGDVRNVRTQPGESARFDGLIRLQMPWREDVALRLSMTDYDQLKIHLFHGETGTTLAYYEREHPRWTAYVTERQAGRPRPETYFAAATDEARTRRTRVREGAPLELRCRTGEVILSHGDVVLLRAPLDQMPTETYFEGHSTFYGLAAVRSKLPPESPPAFPVLFDSDRPAELKWQQQLGEGSRFECHADGTAELVAAGAQQPAWVACPIPAVGLGEVVLQLDEATVGTGVFIGPGDKRPPHVLRLLKETTSGRTCAALREFDTRELGFPPVQQVFVPFTPQSLWVRLLFACGTVHWWISGDGVHWVAGDKHYGDLNEPATHFGLMHLGGLEQARIRLRRVQVRALPEFQALADPELVRQATPWSPASGFGEWLTKTTESAPPDVDANAWRRASAIRTLAHGCAKSLGTQLIDLLLDDAARQDLPLERRRALLWEAAPLLTIRDDYAQRESLLVRYHALGMEAFRREGQRPYSWIRHDLMSVPLGSHDDVRVAREETIRAEFIQLSYQERWPELLSFCRQLRVFRQTDVTPLLDWAESTALRHLPQGTGGERLVARKADWSPPWIEEVSKPTYNFLAELQAMLDSGAWDDAARLIVSLDPEMLLGLAPDVRDPRCHLSLRTAIGAALDDAAPLQQAIRQQYSEVAELRIRAAIQRSDSAALELATVQFAGTEAAAIAHRWLGDRALAGGWFTTAQVQYRRGWESAGPVLRADLEARQRLAAAMQGRRLDGPTRGEVVFGENRLSPEEFDKLIDEMVSSRSSTTVVAGESTVSAEFQPTGFKLQRRGRLDGPVGKDPGTQTIPHVTRFDVDWVGRQIATVMTDDMMYVGNRFHLAAYRLTDGSRVWQATPADATPLRSTDWGLIPMRPLVTNDRLFARLMVEPGPILVCMDRASGQLRWTAETAQGEWVISDPVMIQGQLAALTIKRQDQGTSLVRLAVFDADTGGVQTAYDVLLVNEVWWRRRCCEALVVEDSLIVTMSGVTFRCDLSGNLQWLRRQTVLPPDEEPRWVTQYFQRPLCQDRRIFVAQPGVAGIDCLDVRTGRTIWSRVLPDVQRMIGLVDGRLIVQTATEMLGIAPDSGEILWQHRLPGILHGVACDAKGVMFAQPAASRRLARKEGCHLVWLDAATGDATAVAALSELNVAQPRLGPFTLWRDRVWTFFGQDKNEANPELLELIPEGSADLAWDPAIEPDPWTRHVPLDLLRTVRKRFPGWQLISGDIDRTGPLQPERQGRTNVLVTHAKPNNPVVFTREVSIPSTGQPRLRFTFGHAADRDWVLEVRLAGETLHHEEISGRSQREPWKTTEIDLAPAAGRRGALVIEAQFRGGGESVELFWDDIEIVF